MTTNEVTTREILEKSVASIEAGDWICGEILDSEKAKGGKFVGCALGLVGIHAGHVIQDEPGCYVLHYPTEAVEYGYAAWSDAALKAVELLALASGDKGVAADDNIYDFEATVIAKNDNSVVMFDSDGDHSGSRRLTPEEAAQWFRDAIELAD